MCGIGGVVLKGTTSEGKRIVDKVGDALRHRGPDDSGAWVEQVNEHVLAFTHRRLAIIDLSPTGHQPMVDPISGSVIIYNGEIYNFRALRRELESKGERFIGSSDTEVILRGFRVWGCGIFAKLRGMFALAIYDRSRQRLLLARDSIGIKPLYFYRDGDVFVFASEVRAMLQSELVPRGLSQEGLEGFLEFGALQEPFTIIHGVRSIDAGTWLDISFDGDATVHRFAQLTRPGTEAINAYDDVSEIVDVALANAVKRQLESDVPVGLFLSGGVDSAALLAYIARLGRGDVRTFTVSFPEDAHDEGDAARRIAAHYGVSHEAVLLSSNDIREMLGKAIFAYDQPSVDGVNAFLVAGAAAAHGIKVALSGLGGDELFCGYNAFARHRLAYRTARFLRHIPLQLRESPSDWLGLATGGEVVRKFAELLRNPNEPYFAVRRVFSNAQIKKLIHVDARSLNDWHSTAYNHVLEESTGRDLISEISALEIRTYMRSTLLRDTDQMAMAHGLEVRVPLLDEDVVGAVFSVNGEWRMRGLGTKPLLTGAAGTLPEDVARRPKQGFDLPWERWLLGAAGDAVREASSGVAETSSVFRADGIAQLWNAYRRGDVKWSRVWGLHVLLNWLDLHNVRH